MEPPAVLPVTLLLSGRSCLVVGGGETAARKVDGLLAACAIVTVVAPRLGEALRDRLAEAPEVTWRERAYESEDLAGMALVFTTTGIQEVDHVVSTDAIARGLFVNSADDPANCSFFLAAVVRRDPVLVSISTSGASPGLAAFLRRRLEAELETCLGGVALVLSDVRTELQDCGVSTESLDWGTVIGPELFDLVTDGRTGEAHRFVVEHLR
ncbi:MAG TPA: bifunctional precorrin-2 dehydrogenase/sirohydrochlorin ferrochelatase [Acidimicrobiales bacterium]|jgi:siroheme synthase-like protein|nr:bifunctional precorrin-2 dehydrogenase/sirohydrochlorin ferrochelatase [Acidimicrobiales bacterium]